jgi:malate dehydrogenase (oxaloacetate-decarboxylating)(NADP+)
MSTPIQNTGYTVLHDSLVNRGTAFTGAQRKAAGLEGLLPPGVDTLELQIARVHTQLDMLDTDLQRYLF